MKTLEPESDGADSLENLIRRLNLLDEDSIRQSIKKLVDTTLIANGDEDAEEIAKEAVKVYDLRSELVHDGSLEPSILRQATSDARNILERVSRARFVQRANSPIT